MLKSPIIIDAADEIIDISREYPARLLKSSPGLCWICGRFAEHLQLLA